MKKRQDRASAVHPIFIVSGGVGASGEQLVRTALAQFEDANLPVVVVPHVRTVEQVNEVVRRAAANQGTIIHTLVETNLRRTLIQLAREKNAVAIDPLGPLLSRMAMILDREPIGQPGLYRQLREAYFDRVDAIEFAVAHDDGKKVDELHHAEIVLVGPSRVGKTPLSMYLSVLGWKVANVPLIPEMVPPPELFAVDRQRVVGVSISASQLVAHRRRRQGRLGTRGGSAYQDPVRLAEELEAAELVFRRGRFPVIDVTDKPIEESAEEVIALVTRAQKV
jgi:[pyruvate, water dikinase]-phosphate phosphotransferase / [pyruvate, water dikinase] kinase